MRNQAHVKPELIRWARSSARLSESDLADRLQVDVADVQAWERGEPISIAKLRALGEVCRRPLAVFYLAEPPRDFDAARLPDYRTLPEADLDRDRISPNLALELRRAFNRQRVARELDDDIAYGAPGFSLRASLTDDPDELATRLREFLGLKAEGLPPWRDADAGLRELRSRAAERGILVFRISIPLDELRGFSLGGDRFPVIALNSKESTTARNFTFMHELTHLALHEEGLCDLKDGPEAEVFCNRVAGAALVPARTLASDPDVASRRADERLWDDTALARVGGRFGVSREVIARRLLLLGLLSERFYAACRRRWQKEVHKEAKGGPEKQPIKVLRTCGELFTRLVVASRAEGAITLSEASSLLNVRVQHVDAIAALSMGSGVEAA